MDEIIKIKDEYYILATSSLADDRTRVLKHGETFGIFDKYGDILPFGINEQGIFHEGTRYLSHTTFLIEKKKPLLLSSTVKNENDLLTVDLTNPDFSSPDGEVLVPRGTIHVFRSKFLYDGCCFEKFRVSNFGSKPMTVKMSIFIDTDYADIFEVRGNERDRRGERLPDTYRDGEYSMSYMGLDKVKRTTLIECVPQPNDVSNKELFFEVLLEPHGETTIHLNISCSTDRTPAKPLPAEKAMGSAVSEAILGRQGSCVVASSNDQFNNWLKRSEADLHMMMTCTPEGYYPYAGVPWFSAPFGRDGIITAYQMLWVNPELAKGVLNYLSANQATEVNKQKDSTPGKILHEARLGEMAALGEVPFGKYYGSIDSTPLFLMLFAEYYERTGDSELVRNLWMNIENAVRWINEYGDLDGDGFVEYARMAGTGLVHQGWKDSHDSVFHRDSALAEPPIALCEVQGYVYAAKKGAAKLARIVGYHDLANDWEREAHLLHEKFETAFWNQDLGTYVIALDGEKQPCAVRSSNAGHCLWTGIATPSHAWQTAQTLMGTDMFSGWGVRTIARGQGRYNPMSYHNGSIWPHDNALVAAGLARYGLKEPVLKILTGLFEASQFFDLHRLPELFCGFDKRPGEAPTLYPLACAPQAWASGAVFMLLQAALGLQISAPDRCITLRHPVLPSFLNELHLSGLHVNDAVLDLRVTRHEEDVSINITRREGEVRLVSIK